MSKPSVPSPPPQPNPNQVAAAQTGSNVETAIANSYLQNANQYTPYGSTTFSQTGTQTVGGTPTPQYNSRGQITGYTTNPSYQIPQFSQTTTLSPAEQQKLDQSYALNSQLTNIASSQANRIGGLLGQPVQSPNGSVQTGFGNTAQGIQYNVNPASHAQDRTAVEQALFARINPQLELQGQQLDTKLQNEGFVRGTDAYNTAMDQQNRAVNDARLAVTGAGLNEQQGLFGMDLASLQANNAAQNQDYNQQYQRAGFNNQGYAQELQTLLALRNQPINEISALMSGNQVNLPQFQGYQAGQVQGTPVGDYYYQNANLANQQYMAQLQNATAAQSGLYGGIGSVLGAGLYGLTKFSDRRVKRDIKRIGTWLNGLPVYLYRYLWSPFFEVGFMAQDVEKVMPEAVMEINGIKAVNYTLAVRG